MALKSELSDIAAINMADYLLLLIFTGLRRSEGMKLKWENVDLIERTLTIPQTKNGEPLVLPLSGYVYDLLKHRSDNQSSEFVFPGEGEHGHLVEPRKQMRKVIKRSVVTFARHDLRPLPRVWIYPFTPSSI